MADIFVDTFGPTDATTINNMFRKMLTAYYTGQSRTVTIQNGSATGVFTVTEGTQVYRVSFDVRVTEVPMGGDANFSFQQQNRLGQ